MSGLPSGSGVDDVSAATVRRAWQIASRLVAYRPWLDVSWADWYGEPGHLVVHDGVHGPALHFDDDEGPTWEPGTAPGQEEVLDWEDVEDIDVAAPEDPDDPVDWVQHWGAPAQPGDRTPKTAIYAFIADLLELDAGHAEWMARPAKLVHYTDESADAPDSAFRLPEVFPTLAAPVQFYADQIGGAAWGEGTVWHEPLWLVTRDGAPVVVCDEAGTVHLLPVAAGGDAARSQLQIGVGLARAGSSARLAEIIATASLSDQAAPEATDDGGPGWGWTYDDGPGDYTSALIDRTGRGEDFRVWHSREAVRRRWIRERLKADDSSGYGALDLSLAAEAERLDGLPTRASLDDKVAWHLTHNLFPAVPTSMVPVCVQAIRLAVAGCALDSLNLPDSVTYWPQAGGSRRSAPVAEVIRQHSLSRFVLGHDQLRQMFDRQWDVVDALEAWQLADAGEWEIPSPAPAWPEYVTLLLVGRNFLKPGEEDDPGEQDLIRGWWSPGGWQLGYNPGWWDAETVRLMSLPEPVQPSGESVPSPEDSGGAVAELMSALRASLAGAAQRRAATQAAAEPPGGPRNDPAQVEDEHLREAWARFDALDPGIRRWETLTDGPFPIAGNEPGFGWSDEFDYLEEFLDEVATIYVYNSRTQSRPFIRELSKLWNPLNLDATRSAITELLIDARHPGEDPGHRPWHRDPLAIPQLEALLARAYAQQGEPLEARFAAARAFGAQQQRPGWLPQLEALTNGRLLSGVGDTEAAFDSYWLATRVWMIAGESDFDLLVETFCEMAILGPISPDHPSPALWANLINLLTEDRPDDEWHPGPWFERQFRESIDRIREADDPASRWK